MAGSRVKQTPEPESSPWLPNTMACTLTAVPRSFGDPLLPAVEHGAVGVPGVEDRAHREVELLARVLREVAAGVLADDAP